MINNKLTDNQPSAARLISSLRDTGYTYETAIGDIIDNSIDAFASEIYVYVDHDKKRGYSIIITDNGIGMDTDTLKDSLKFGSKQKEYSPSSLGFYGLGLDTASIGVCKHLEIYSRTEDSDIHLCSQDLDIIYEKDEFLINGPRKADEDEQKFFKTHLHNSPGTIIVWTKCDKIIDKDQERVIGKIKQYIASTYRVFMSLPGQAKLSIYLNQKLIEPADPLMLNFKGPCVENTQIWSDDNYSFKIEDQKGNIINEEVRCRMVLLPDFGDPVTRQKMSREYGINEVSSGFNIFRNNREIMSAQTFGLYSKNPIMNRFRAEIYFTSAFDSHLGINFSKMNISLTESLIDQLRQNFGPQISSLRSKALKKMNTSAKEKIDLSAIEKYIQQRSSFLVKPDREKEIRAKKKLQKDSQKDSQSDSKPTIKEKNVIERQRLRRADIVKALEANCKFEQVSNGSEGPVYSYDIKGKVLIIYINMDHPFYMRFFADREDNDMHLEASCLLYAMASADKLIEHDDVRNVLRPWKTFMSTNLYGLLTDR